MRPLLLLGETDAAARLTLSRDFSPNVSLAVGIDLRNAQRQTWVVDVHGLRRLPPVSAQLFTEDYGRYGGTLQQRIDLGGARRAAADASAPIVGSVGITPPAGVSRRALVTGGSHKAEKTSTPNPANTPEAEYCRTAGILAEASKAATYA